VVVEAENVRCNDNGDYGDGGCGGMVIVKMTIMVWWWQ